MIGGAMERVRESRSERGGDPIKWSFVGQCKGFSFSAGEIRILRRGEISSDVHFNGVTPAASWRRGLQNNTGDR